MEHISERLGFDEAVFELKLCQRELSVGGNSSNSKKRVRVRVSHEICDVMRCDAIRCNAI